MPRSTRLTPPSALLVACRSSLIFRGNCGDAQKENFTAPNLSISPCGCRCCCSCCSCCCIFNRARSSRDTESFLSTYEVIHQSCLRHPLQGCEFVWLVVVSCCLSPVLSPVASAHRLPAPTNYSTAAYIPTAYPSAHHITSHPRLRLRPFSHQAAPGHFCAVACGVSGYDNLLDTYYPPPLFQQQTACAPSSHPDGERCTVTGALQEPSLGTALQAPMSLLSYNK